MSTGFYSIQALQKCRQTILNLAFCVVLSSGFGILIASSADPSYFLMMRMAVTRPVSIVHSALYCLIPFLISVFLIVHSKQWLVYCICAVHVILFTAAGYAMRCIYPRGYWLVHWILQFPNVCFIPVILYLCICRFTSGISRHAVAVCICIATLVGLIHSCLISPFGADLMNLYETLGRYATNAGFDWCLRKLPV